jgi:hypothetical protein
MIEKMYDKYVDNATYKIYNPASINWNLFRWDSGYIKHYVTHDEIYKFYLVSIQYYGTREYMDYILRLNNVATEFDLFPGALIKIPILSDLQNFILKYQKND